MSINPEDVKLYESQRLSDENDGGGRATGREVIDGNINNLFEDISRLDRTVGDVALRKAFVGVDTNNSDLYLGAHAIITEPPADPLVNVLIFDAGNEYDERASAQDRIESYVVQGAAAQFEFIGNQFENQRQIVCIQRLETALPATGDVYLIKEGNDEQYVRITQVDAEPTVFSYETSSGFVDFTRMRLVLSISAPLEQTFTGGQPTPGTTTGNNNAKIFGTEVADAARYWGVKKSEEPASVGDLKIKVDSIYSSLVPSAQSEQPLLNQVAGYESLIVIAGRANAISEAITGTYTSGTNFQVFTNRACVRRSLSLIIGGSSYTDNGSGILTRASGSFPFATLNVDYDSGAIFGTRDSGTGSGNVTGTASYIPGAGFTGRAVSLQREITINNRGYNWTYTFAQDKPRPGTMIVSYMAQGRWYELRDNGTGQLIGTGTGSVDYATGTTLVTTEALPDVGTAIIYNWIMDIDEEYETHEGTIADWIPEIQVQMDDALVPGTITITYTSGGNLKTVTDDGAGNLQGDGEGTINYTSGLAKLKPITIHDDGTTFDATYTSGIAFNENYENYSAGTRITSGTFDNVPVSPGTVEIMMAQRQTGRGVDYLSARVLVRDDGAGGWLGGIGGSIDYQTGYWEIVKAENYAYSYQEWYRWEAPASGWESSIRTVNVTGLRYLKESYYAKYRQAGDPNIPSALVGYNPGALEVKLVPTGDDIIIEDSVLFVFGGQKYYDRDGIIYRGFDSKTGAGTAVGTIDYQERIVTLNTWTGGAAPGVNILSLTTAGKTSFATSMVFRTPGAPIRPTSLQIIVTDLEGNIINITSDSEGDLIAPGVIGKVNYQTGIVALSFTTDESDATGASMTPVQGNGIYNAVLFSFLPLDAELIGLDPVRLPSDGRVPIYRTGDVVVISNNQEVDIGTPADNAAIDLGDTFIASAIVYDSTGKAMDPAQYTVAKEQGIVQFADPVLLQDANTNPITAPLTIKYRIEHMTLLNDVQITGELSFIAPLAHDYPAGCSVSSALLWGDLNSRVYSEFTQKVWNSGDPNWTDQRQGDETTAQYNNIDNPIEYANNGAITEKWALWFYSSTSFYIVGEQLGVIGQGNINGDTAPMNPNKNEPYFVVRQAGWGIGWATNNVLRFNTEGCLGPIWLSRTTLSGQATQANDQFTLQLRGDAD